MGEFARRVAVTGASSPVGRRVVELLRDHPEFEHVRGVEERESRNQPKLPDLDVVRFQPDHRPFVEYLEEGLFDTVIQCGLARDRLGRRSRVEEADVIGTMCLGVAISSGSVRVRNWILASSSAFYPISSSSPLVRSETLVGETLEGSVGASVAEAEEYARDVAHRAPHINVAILRLQELASSDARGKLAELLARDPVPTPIGFDPAIQLLHLEDAARALAFASSAELAGVYNVASSGMIHWHQAVDAVRHTPIPVLPIGLATGASLLQRLRVPFVPSDSIDLLRFGQVLDTRKIEAAGWKPMHDQRSCLVELR